MRLMTYSAMIFAATAILSVGAGAATKVTSSPLSELLIRPQISAPATVRSLNDSRLSAELMARIESIRVRVGDRVSSGDLLVELDCRTHQSQLQSQRSLLQELNSQISQASSQLKRARSLRKQRNISDEQVEQRETDLSVLRARQAVQQQRIIQSRIQVERCRIRAPFDGIVRERLAHEGELTSSGSHLLRLQQLDNLEVSAELRPDQNPVDARNIAFEYQGRLYPLRLRHLLPVIDTRSRTREARFEFAAEPAAPAGAAGRLVWTDSNSYVPADLLVRRQYEGRSRLGIMLLVGDLARFLPLPDAIEGQSALIELPVDSRLIVEGRKIVSDGEKVDNRSIAKIADNGRTSETEAEESN